MALKDQSLSDLWVLWTVVLSILLAPIALMLSPNDLRSIVKHLSAAGALAAVAGAYGGTIMWLVVQAAD